MPLTAAQALPLIRQYESGGRNILNQPLPGQAPSTASGYYQIINGTWTQFGPQAGVDLNQYPTAISAPESVQTQVATAIYNKQGIAPWSTNAPLMTAIGSAGGNDVFAGGGGAEDTGGIGPGGSNPSLGPTGATSAAASLLAPVTEYLVRGGLLFIGAGLVFIALAALLWQSKTVQVSVNSLGKAAAATA